MFEFGHPIMTQFFSKRQNCRLVQIESICRQQNEHGLKIVFFRGKSRKLCVKAENAGYQHFLLFVQCFQVIFLWGR